MGWWTAKEQAVVAAGMLAAADGPDRVVPIGEAAHRLTALLDDSTFWRRADYGADLRDPRWVVHPVAAAAWVAPVEPVPLLLAAALNEALDSARRARPSRHGGHPGDPHHPRMIVRLTVPDVTAARRLTSTDDSGPARVVPLIAARARRFSWRWPMRVGVLAGPRSADWHTAMVDSHHAGKLYDVRIVDRPVTEALDILVVDDAAMPAGTEHAFLRPGQVTCVLVAGSGRPVDLLLARAAEALHPAVAAGVAAEDARWFVPLVHELSHDQPLDVALSLAGPPVLVAGDPELTALTAVGRWAAAVAAGRAGDPAAARLAEFVDTSDFSFESYGATDVSTAARPLVGTLGEFVIMRDDVPEAAGAPEIRPALARRLLADIRAQGRLCRRALAPDTDHLLEVRIAVPRRPGYGVPFDDAAVPEGDGVVRLTVVVTCADIGLRAQAEIDLPTADRTKPSGVAAFAFRTGTDGEPLRFEIVVLHGNRPIQAARVLATVRATPANGDRVQILPVPLTAHPEPAPDATRADLSLDARKGPLENMHTGGSVDLERGEIADLLDAIEQRASRVLASEGRIAWQPGERAPELLVDLARLGAELHRKVEDVDDAGARTVSLLVRYDSPILPLELAYSGPAPRETARLCTHATEAPAAPGPCAKASAAIVCPYGFWGMHRTIARTVEKRQHRNRTPRPPGPLRLRPVLYAATDRADNDLPPGTPEEEFPSRFLQQALRDALGVEVARVTSWSSWRRQVRETRPELLVVLAHTETVRGWPSLQIGRRSSMAQPDVTAALVGAGGESPGPLVVLLACVSAAAGNTVFGALPATFTDRGAAAVVATLSKLKGPDGARAAAAVIAALSASAAPQGTTLGVALTAARRSLLTEGLLVGLVLVAHGEIDVKLTGA